MRAHVVYRDAAGKKVVADCLDTPSEAVRKQAQLEADGTKNVDLELVERCDCKAPLKP